MLNLVAKAYKIRYCIFFAGKELSEGWGWETSLPEDSSTELPSVEGYESDDDPLGLREAERTFRVPRLGSRPALFDVNAVDVKKLLIVRSDFLDAGTVYHPQYPDVPLWVGEVRNGAFQSVLGLLSLPVISSL